MHEVGIALWLEESKIDNDYLSNLAQEIEGFAQTKSEVCVENMDTAQYFETLLARISIWNFEPRA